MVVSPAFSNMESLGEDYIQKFSLADIDAINEMPVLGVWVHPGSIALVCYLEHGVSDGKSNGRHTG